MEEKMTSGEIAKKTGVSQKAIRLYDEKGLLKPTDYSEGNYRLYDKNALLVLEKIIALKEVGFSLEEIKENLSQQNDTKAFDVLQQQLKMMEDKKNKLEKAIICIKNAMERCKDSNDWDVVADVIRTIQMDQGADERHFDALKFSADTEPWYVKIYHKLGLNSGEKVLDIGCGFGKLWRENWKEIPEDVKIDAYDLHGSWAEDLFKFVEENKGQLASGTSFEFKWKDVEEDSTWGDLNEQAYDHIIAYYLLDFLKNEEVFLERVSKVLADDGVFCCNGVDVNKGHFYWKEKFDEIGIDTKFIDTRVANCEKMADEFASKLRKYFSKVEKYEIESARCYTNTEDVFARLETVYAENKKMLSANESKIKSYFNEKMEKEGKVVMETTSTFWKCWK